ncbi:MAG: LysR family transcriptional regulator [Rhodobacteraceae bacterium]|nr:LysR family transcriptional regulator [Paracoccaceae bacterium]
MNIEHIRAFLEVTSNGSFQIAADQLNVTQSTISARIKSLEDRLNRSLFRRKRNGIELTSGGHQFHPHAVELVRSWERGQQMVSLPEGTESVVSLGIESNHWSRIIPSWANFMGQKAPSTALNATAGSSGSLMTKLKSGMLDLAILYEPQHTPEVAIELLIDDILIMVSSEPRSVESGEVPGYIFVDWGESFRSQHNLHFPGVFSHKMTVSSAEVAQQHILSNGGSGYFLESVVMPYLESGLLHIVENAPKFTRPVYIGKREDPETKDIISTAVQAIKQSIIPQARAAN